MFQIGDEVKFLDLETLTLKDGIVTEIDLDADYPVTVSFENDKTEIFTQNGFLFRFSKLQQLYHKGTTLELKVAPEPKRQHKLQKDDLVWVWDDHETRNSAVVRCFSHFNVYNQIECFVNGKTSNTAERSKVWSDYEEVKHD